MSKKTKVKTEPWGPAKEHILGAQKNLNSAFSQAQPGAVNNAATINALIPQLADRASTPSALTTAAQGYATDVLGGKYLTDNPHISGMIDQTGRSVSDRVNSTFSRAGRTGGDQHVQVLGRELSDAENRLRYQNYSDERTSMGQMAAVAPSLEGMDFQSLQPLLAAAQLGGTLPMANASMLAGATSGLLSPYTTRTQTDPWQNTVGNALGLAMMAFGGPGGLPSFGGGGK